MAAFNVLIVDDQRDVARMLQSALETLEEEFNVTSVLSGEEALLEIRLHSIDLLITDVRLPGMSGLELVEKLRNQKPEIKVILITGVTEEAILEAVASAFVEAYFLKPIELADFLDAVERILGIVDTPASMVPEEEAEEVTISDRIAQLRHELDAVAVLLLDELGEVVVRAGEFPGRDIDSSLITPIMAAYSAGLKISHFMQTSTPEQAMVFNGKTFDLVMSPVGQSYLLMVVTVRGDGEDEYLGRSGRLFVRGVRELLEMLANLGVPIPTNGTPIPVKQEYLNDVETDESSLSDVDEELVNVLNKGSKIISEDEVESFWDEEENTEEASGVFDSGVLTFDQAQQLGIAPEDED